MLVCAANTLILILHCSAVPLNAMMFWIYWYAPPYYILFYPTWSFLMVCYAMPCYAMLCYAILCSSSLFYSVLLCSVLLCSTLFYSSLFYSMVVCSILFCAILFCRGCQTLGWCDPGQPQKEKTQKKSSWYLWGLLEDIVSFWFGYICRVWLVGTISLEVFGKELSWDQRMKEFHLVQWVWY